MENFKLQEVFSTVPRMLFEPLLAKATEGSIQYGEDALDDRSGLEVSMVQTMSAAALTSLDNERKRPIVLDAPQLVARHRLLASSPEADLHFLESHYPSRSRRDRSQTPPRSNGKAHLTIPAQAPQRTVGLELCWVAKSLGVLIVDIASVERNERAVIRRVGGAQRGNHR